MQMFHGKEAAPIYKCYNGKGSSNIQMLSWKREAPIANVIMEKGSSNMQISWKRGSSNI